MATRKSRKKDGAAEDIERLRSRHEDLCAQRIRADEQRRAAEKELESLRGRAREEWGTDDLGALRERLEEMRAENERLRAAYQRHIEEIESRLAEVERDHARAVAGREDGDA